MRQIDKARRDYPTEREVAKKREYTMAEKKQAAIEYQLTGTLAAVSRNLGIPYYTIQGWQKQEWWHEMRESVRKEAEDRIEAQTMELIDTAHKVAMEALTEGDEKVAVHRGEITRYKVKPTGKEAATIMGIAYDKRRLTLNMPTSIKGSVTGLDELADQFRELTRSFKEKRVNSIEGELEEDA